MWYNLRVKKHNAERLKPIGIWLRDRIPLAIPSVVTFVILTLILNAFIKNVAHAVTAAGTLTLALAAFWAIWSSNEQEKRRRKDEKAKEERDRKERQLREVIDWATDVAKCSLEKGVFDESIPMTELQAEGVLYELLASVIGFRMARAASVYISNITSEIDPTLKTKVDNLLKELIKQISLLMAYKRRQPTPVWPAEPVVKEIAGNNERLYSLATEVIDKAANIQKRELPSK